jgi:hypothetical protein
MDRAAILISILPCFGEVEGQSFMFCTMMAAKNGLLLYGFSGEAQLQATGNTSCWHKAFLLYIM